MAHWKSAYGVNLVLQGTIAAIAGTIAVHFTVKCLV